MGWLARVVGSVGSSGWGEPDPGLLAGGLVGRGVITGLQQTRQTLGADQSTNYEVVCDIAMDVKTRGRPPFQATMRQPVRVSELIRIVPGETGVVVRVDRADQRRVAIDWALTITHDLAPPGVSGPRVVRTRTTTAVTGMTISRRRQGPPVGSAAEVLASGRQVRVELLQCEPYPGTKSAEGLDMYLFTFLVSSDGQELYGVQVGNPVPPQALGLLQPWRDLPAKAMADEPGRVVIDWPAALAEQPQ